MTTKRYQVSIKDKKGQFVIEAVLLMVVSVSLLIWGTQQLREGKYLAKLIGGPWKKVAGMIESGVWETPEKAKALHPNQLNRSNSAVPN